MIESAEIENFRGIRSAKLTNCRAVNVVLGPNASGKTALLEALFLALGPGPDVALRFRIWRGYDQAFAVLPGPEVDAQLWRDLFFGFDLKKEIKISTKGTDDHARSLTVSYDQNKSFTQTSNQPIQFFPSPIKFTYSRPAIAKKQVKRTWVVEGHFIGGGYQFSGMEPSPVDCAFFSATMNFTNKENADRYSDISRRGDEQEIFNMISNEFGFITGLEILTLSGLPTLHVKSPLYDDKRPLSSISTGVSKYVSLALAISSMNGGVVFIDEIENGFYYDRYESIWRSLISLAKKHKVQIFVATHSLECLEALNEATSDTQDDVMFIRSTLNSHGEIGLEQFRGATIFGAMETGEVR
jgi:AAA15 family ATPase/GTPase